jgi:hypothetical protein
MITTLCLLIPLVTTALRVTSPPIYKPTEVVIRGSTPPFEKFDPFKFSKDENQTVFFREAELKHGRIAMIASATIPLIEQFTHKTGIHEFDSLPTNVKLLIIGTTFMSEFSSMLRGWEKPTDKPFTLRQDYQPGDYEFSIIDLTTEESGELLDKELNNGRLAMIGALGMIVQELVTDRPLF